MKIDNLETLLKPITDDLGVKLKIEGVLALNPFDEEAGLRLKVSIPQTWSRGHVNIDEMLTTYAQVDQVVHSVVKTIEHMQQQCFERMWHHLQTHDTTGKVRSLQKIAKLAVELAKQHISPDREEYKCLEHYLEYLNDVERRLYEKYKKEH